MEIQEILLLLTLISTILISTIGFGFTIYQIKKSNKVKQAEFINKLLENMILNERALNAEYIIDYDEHWYDENFHFSGELEKNIDAYFSQINYICYLYEEKLLSDKDFSIFKYQILRVIDDEQCKSYLWNLYHWSKSNETKCSFDNYINYMIKQLSEIDLKKFESSEEKISGFKKYLNFD